MVWNFCHLYEVVSTPTKFDRRSSSNEKDENEYISTLWLSLKMYFAWAYRPSWSLEQQWSWVPQQPWGQELPWEVVVGPVWDPLSPWVQPRPWIDLESAHVSDKPPCHTRIPSNTDFGRCSSPCVPKKDKLWGTWFSRSWHCYLPTWNLVFNLTAISSFESTCFSISATISSKSKPKSESQANPSAIVLRFWSSAKFTNHNIRQQITISERGILLISHWCRNYSRRSHERHTLVDSQGRRW